MMENILKSRVAVSIAVGIGAAIMYYLGFEDIINLKALLSVVAPVITGA